MLRRSTIPWYENGVRFKCTGCGKCCTGSPGYVWLSENDIFQMAKHLGISEVEFLETYTRRVGDRYSLLEDNVNYDCIFLKEKKFCSVYEARPRQCQTFPWWPENITSKEEYESLASYCEGVDHPEADVVQLETIMKDSYQLPPEILNRVNSWLTPEYDEKTQNTIRELLTKDPKALLDPFSGELEFGTAGLRGVMGVGPNRLNKYTIRKATQGLANYLGGAGSVVIGYDNRHHSKEFAFEAAKVLAGNNITLFISTDLRPTPFVSYACRRKNASAAIMITASHNPKEYNGYKVYWSDGAQIVPPHDTGIMNEVSKVTSILLAEDDDPRIHFLSEKDDTAYIETISQLQRHPDYNKQHGRELKIIYSNLHGAGITLMNEGLRSWGFSNVHCVPEQLAPDGDFPTTKKPNPEEEEALSLGIKQLVKEKGDIFLASDPDADRIGVVVMHHGEPLILNGNQIASVCVDHILRSKLPTNGAIVTTIVSTRLLKELAKEKNIECFDVLTGFKYIGELIKKWEDGSHTFLFGAEESHGYLIGTHARDKDAIVASALVAEVALQAKREGQTLIDRLDAIYKRHGYFYEEQKSITFPPSKESMEKMRSILSKLRNAPPKEFGVMEDYNDGKHLDLPKANVLAFDLEDSTRLIIRPSGTEPKIKIYGHSRAPYDEGLDSCKKRLQSHIQKMADHINILT